MSNDPSLKRCSKCGESRPHELFHKDKNRNDGLFPHCKVCRAEYAAVNAEKFAATSRARRKNNVEKYREKKRAYYDANKEKIQNYRKIYYAENRQKILEQQRKYYSQNADRIRSRKRSYPYRRTDARRKYQQAYYRKNAKRLIEYQYSWRTANLELYRAYQQRWRIAHRDARLAYKRKWKSENKDRFHTQRQKWRAANPDRLLAYNHNRRARLRSSGGSFTSHQIKALRITQNESCIYCERSTKLTIDHIIPLKQNGSNDISNICLACRRCNCSKGARTPEQWTNRWYERDDADE